MPVPSYTEEFLEIDDRAGWYAGAAWDEADVGRLDFLFYNNEANPNAIKKQVAWRTRFWNVGARTNIGPVTLLAQGMTGETFIWPSPFFFSETNFESAYLLAVWTIGEDWRLAARYDWFQTEEYHNGTSVRMNEHGNAMTFAVNYLPTDWLRVTAEYLRLDSTRTQRTIVPDAAKAVENQLQISARFYIP